MDNNTWRHDDSLLLCSFGIIYHNVLAADTVYVYPTPDLDGI